MCCDGTKKCAFYYTKKHEKKQDIFFRLFLLFFFTHLSYLLNTKITQANISTRYSNVNKGIINFKTNKVYFSKDL